MRIEELILEGFKSYPVRTTITDWDPSFNAITGLNGSGKSNILDAIAFVLGITNMSTMRAANQQDLIYKRGQAGITKASVTIVFDNSDRAKSPVGQENNKQITVTRQIALGNVSKYLLNGHKSEQSRIHTLFQSVQLNINNPNFVIMQGRITKVLNMRPQEILGMVEEAAGTRMFEERKDKAKKTMTKKEKRVQEVTSILQEEIAPKLEKLRAEKRSFIEWQKACSELERIAKLLRAFEWTEARERVTAKQVLIDKKKAEKDELERMKRKAGKEADAAEAEVAKVIKNRDEEMRKGGKLAKLEEEVAGFDKDLTKTRTQVDIKQGTIRDEEARVQASEQELKELETSLEAKQQEVEALTATYTTIKDQHTVSENKLNADEELLQTLLTGLSSSKANNTGGGYMGQIADAKGRLAKASAEEEQTNCNLQMQQKELKVLEARWKEVERDAGDGKKKVEAMKGAVEQFRKKLITCGWNAEMEEALETKLNNLRTQVRDLKQKRDSIKRSLGSLDFDYPSPYPNFDRSKVKGRLGSLVSLREENFDKATALEITAGSRLNNVIVQDEKVGKDLLSAKLSQRVNLIPLNKIQPYEIRRDKIAAAERAAPGKTRVALSLVGYPPELAKAMSFVFGGTLICDDAQAAKTVTFNRDISVKSVTLEGDSYDPSGTLSGGAKTQSSGILIQVQEWIQVDARLAEAGENLRAAEREEEANRKKRDDWKRLTRELEIKEHEVKLLEEQVVGSNAARIGTQVETLKQTIKDLQDAVKAAQDKQKLADSEVKKLQRDMDEFKNNKDGKIDELKGNISKQKAALQKHAVKVKTQQKELQTARLELEQIENDIEGAKAVVEEVRAGVAKLRKELGKLEDQASTIQASYEKAAQKLKEERATLSRFDNELKELDKVIKEKKEAVTKAEIELTTIDHDIAGLGKEKTAASNTVDKLEKQYEWILEDHESFGVEGGQYDFRANNMNQLRSKADELEKLRDAKKKKINPKVMNMIEDVEKKDASSRKMLATVMKDKEKIEETIEELDRFKRDALEKTWTKVNADFGGIFAELLPGNFAKLQPPEDQDLTDGLEVKVQLGSVWKQSLTELSGGQRSLIALSLIMALLQFKPAPMYILDEIDAALDLSHTQHIGQLFRTRFKGSQFIVVSLKEGLFTNANVLFKARFRDGTSVVERTAQRSTSGLYDKDGDEDNNRNAARRARR